MDGFDEFWAIARRWRGSFANPKKPARLAWARAVRNGADPEQMIEGAKGYARAMANEDNLVMWNMAATFINQERWEQYVEQQAEEAEAAGSAHDRLMRTRAEAVKRQCHMSGRESVAGRWTTEEISEVVSAGYLEAAWLSCFGPALKVVGS